MIPFNPALPNIAKSQPAQAFRVGHYLALLIEKPKSLADAGGIGSGLITYLYALAVVTTSKPTDLVLIVTSEQSGPELHRIAKEKSGIEQTTDPFLCVFDEKGGHHNLGHSSEWANQEAFVRRALEIVRQHLQVAEAPVEVQPGSSHLTFGGALGRSHLQYLLAVVGALIGAMLLFPPYRVSGAQGVIWRTGYAWIFDLPNSATVDVGQIFVQWVGVLIVGGIAYLLLSKRS